MRWDYYAWPLPTYPSWLFTPLGMELCSRSGEMSSAVNHLLQNSYICKYLHLFMCSNLVVVVCQCRLTFPQRGLQKVRLNCMCVCAIYCISYICGYGTTHWWNSLVAICSCVVVCEDKSRLWNHDTLGKVMLRYLPLSFGQVQRDLLAIAHSN